MAKSNSFKMTKQMQQILIALLVLAVIIYAVKKYRDKDEQDQIKAGTDSNGVPKQDTTTSSVPAWKQKYNALPSLGGDATLKKGVKAKEVWSMQYYYNERIAKKEGKSTIKVDGIFGSETQTALDYVTYKKRSSITLTGWDYLTKITKAQRYAHFFPSGVTANAPTLSSNVYDPYGNPFPAESTYVYNP